MTGARFFPKMDNAAIREFERGPDRRVLLREKHAGPLAAPR